ncbi:MAG TPA: LysR family transcriptional regulator [Bradyrhizobium sp.]|jgi:DNA-binding transcriptional LysR family regulator
MARVDRFSGLSEFLAVADHASFRAAAAELGVTRAAVSQSIQALERRLGRTLFQRTTRSVALTDAGVSLLASLRPAADQIGTTLDQISGEAERPVGGLRLTVPHIAFDLVLARVLPEFRLRFPEISVELDVNDASVDLASNRYDAGIRIGEWVERDMVAVKLTAGFRWIVVGAPDYLERCGRPQHPKDLLRHECVRYRFPTAASIYRWEFVEAGESFSLDAPGHLTVNDHLSMVALARQGLGLAYTADLVAHGDLQRGALQQVLHDFVPHRQGLYLYFPATARHEPKLRAFIEVAILVQKSGHGDAS